MVSGLLSGGFGALCGEVPGGSGRFREVPGGSGRFRDTHCRVPQCFGKVLGGPVPVQEVPQILDFVFLHLQISRRDDAHDSR